VRTRRGLTLLEVLLVLCLLVVLAALAWPALDRPWANQRLRRAADVVRLAWVRARIDAMASGKTYLFRYELESGRFVVECWQGAEADLESQPGEWFGQADLDAPAQSALLATAERRLPEDVRFTAGQSELDDRANFVLAAITQDTAAGAWSDPVLFYPDGTATAAELRLANQYGRQISVALRGLTGVVTVGEVHSDEEAAP